MSRFAALSGTGKPFRVLLKLAGEPLVDHDGKQAYIDVHSEDSSIGRRFDKEWRDKTIAIATAGEQQPSQVEHNIAKTAALTTGWYLVNPDTLDQVDEPCTPQDALELYSLPDTGWIWIPAFTASNNNANFIKRSAKNSSSTQSANSETGES